VRRYLEQVRRPGTSEEPQRAAALFSLLLPGFSVPDAITELIIIPDGILTDLPFEALRDRSGRRVIERFSISYAPSASTYALLVSREPRSRTDSTLLALGNPVVDGRGAGSQVGREVDAEHASLLSPLRYAAAQMQGLARAYGPAARVLEGPAATEAALRADLSGVSTLHLATRGIVDEGQPGRSRLILTAAADDDGVLQMRELFALRLNRALVTLPAVETAVAVNTRSEGLGGLSRAWFYAGADTVVTSLWTVDARTTPRLMTDFYEAMARGLPAAEALRQAKLRLMNGSAGGTDPFSWAAFVTIGNGAWTGAPPQAPSRWPLMAGAAAAAAAGAAVPAIWWARRRRTSASHS
jgi:CHAT domain-containing protein